MTKEVENKVMLLQEYREGFKEICSVVEQFEELSTETQSIFIKERKDFLQEQLQEIRNKKNDYIAETKKVVAQLNSRFKAYVDNERILQEQIEECNSFISLINNRLEATKTVQDVKGAENVNETLQE